MNPVRPGSDTAERRAPWYVVFGLGALAGGLAVSWWSTRAKAGRAEQVPSRPRRADHVPRPGQSWDIAPGETLLPDGERDLVLEASMESFPASDPPAFSGNHAV